MLQSNFRSNASTCCFDLSRGLVYLFSAIGKADFKLTKQPSQPPDISESSFHHVRTHICDLFVIWPRSSKLADHVFVSNVI